MSDTVREMCGVTHNMAHYLGRVRVSRYQLDNFRKLFPQPASKFPQKIPGKFYVSSQKKAHDVAIEGLGTKKMEKVDIFRSEAIPENGTIESWPSLLVKHTILSTKRPFQLSQIRLFLAAGVNQQLPPVAASSGLIELEKSIQTSKFPGKFPETENLRTSKFPKEFPETLTPPKREGQQTRLTK